MDINRVITAYAADNVNLYKTAKSEKQKSFEVKDHTNAGRDKKVLGIGFLASSNHNMKYGICAEYAEDYSEDNPIIKVTVQTGNGEQAYSININDINPRSATEIEMFALCNYADATGKGTGGTFGSWQTMRYYSINAIHNGYLKESNDLENFKTLKQDWVFMVREMMQDYTNAGLYKQGMDGNKLLETFIARENMDKQEAKTNTNIIVKPDGSRVLVITRNIGGMETTMSLEISKPADTPMDMHKENSEQSTTKTENTENAVICNLEESSFQ